MPVCSSGIDNRVLHNTGYKKKIKNNTLVLMDMGCKYNNYCSDITRTFPINKKFNGKSRLIYTIVLKTQLYSLSLIKPGEYWDNIESKTRLYLYKELYNIGILYKQPTNLQVESTHIIMPHGLGHHVGIDVHDGPEIQQLKENMVVTVEPGVYFLKNVLENKYINRNVCKLYTKIGGIRIEDTIAITKKGYKNLTNISKIDYLNKLTKKTNKQKIVDIL